MKRSIPNSIQERLSALDWASIRADLWRTGYCVTGPVLTSEECADLIQSYGDDSRFRSHIVMARFRFGSGDYKYFAHPLPQVVQELREHSYPELAVIANEWNEALHLEERFPGQHSQLLKMCAARGQTKPTPLPLHYEAGDYNCLHQDLYGDVAFPLQLTCFLSRKGDDYTGGEFVLVEQQPRAQSKVEVISPEQGQLVIFTTRYRPVKGKNGSYRVNVKHGVSRVRSGVRCTLGVIFHDAA